MGRSPHRSRPLLVALEGPSGVGKSSLARQLRRDFGWSVVPEAFTQLRPRPSLSLGGRASLLALERRLLEQENRRYASACRRPSARVALDTGFLGPLTYSWGLRESAQGPDAVDELRGDVETALAAGQLGFADLTFWMDLPAPELARRVTRAVSTHPEEFAERHRRVGAVERRLWLRRLGPEMGARFLRLDASGPLPEIAKRLAQEARKRARLPPPSRADAERWVRAIR